MDSSADEPVSPEVQEDEETVITIQCTESETLELHGLGCDAQDNNCNEQIDECEEDSILPKISFKNGLAVDAFNNADGVTVINSPTFLSLLSARAYLESIVEAVDDCATNLQPEIIPPIIGASCDSTVFTVTNRSKKQPSRVIYFPNGSK